MSTGEGCSDEADAAFSRYGNWASDSPDDARARALTDALGQAGRGTSAAMGWDARRTADYAPSAGPGQDQRTASLLEGLGQAGAGTDAAMGWSPREQDATLRSIDPKTFEYRSPHRRVLDLPSGKVYGTMAQDLERTPLGRTMVRDTPMGKMIDNRVATGATLGLIGRLGERLDSLESR